MIPDRLFLVGYVGAGKTAVGDALAQRLDRPLYCTEALAEAGARQREGLRRDDAAQRQRERRALVAVASGPPSVISTGASVFLDRGNRRTIQQSGVSVFLDASLEECLAEAVRRGAVTMDEEAAERFTTLFEQRQEQYEQADIIVETLDRDPLDIADDILQRLEDRVWTERLE